MPAGPAARPAAARSRPSRRRRRRRAALPSEPRRPPTGGGARLIHAVVQDAQPSRTGGPGGGRWHTDRVRDAFDLDPTITHLNHGSFGAVPRVVSEAQRGLRARAEANPMRFFRVESPGLKAAARATAAEFLGVGDDEVALVRNVTQAAATVLASLHEQGRLGPGDVIVLNEQGYESVKRSVAHWCGRTGASYHVVSFPVGADAARVVQAYRHAFEVVAARGDTSGWSPPTTSPHRPAPCCPSRASARPAREVGALSLVDAAHVPGHVRRVAARDRRGLLDRHLAQVGLRAARHERAVGGRGRAGGHAAAHHELEPRPGVPAAVRHPRHRRLQRLVLAGCGRRVLARGRRSRPRREGRALLDDGAAVVDEPYDGPGCPATTSPCRPSRPRACAWSPSRTAWPTRRRRRTRSTRR